MERTTRGGRASAQRLAVTVALFAIGVAGCRSQVSSPPPKATPIVADGRLAGRIVYVSVGLSAGLTTPGLVEALDAQTGRMQWKAQTVTTSGEPVVAQGALYVGADDGTVRAFDATTGQSRWSFTRTVGVSAQLGLDGYVAVDGGAVFVTSDGGAIYALDSATGKQRWLYTLPATQSHIYTVPVVAGGLVYVAAGGIDGAVYALDAATGKLHWKAAQEGGFDGQPVIVGGALYVGATNSPTFYVYNAQTGAQLWTYDTSSSVISPAAIGPEMVYMCASDSAVYALRANHTLAWKFQTGGNAPTPLIARGAAPTLDGQTLYVGSQGGVVYALDATSGKPRWSVALNSSIDMPPTLLDGTLFVTTEAGDIVALRASDGARVWHTASGGFIIGAPLVTTPTGAA